MTEKLYSVINACRLCQSPSLDTVYQFGGVPLANAYPETSSQQEVKFPLTLVRCTKCGHVQLRETVNPEVLFTNYSYASADSPALVKHFHGYASTIKSRLDLTNDSFLLEVGCNDGLLLREFVDLGMVNLFGIEPALNMAEKLMGSGAFIINQYFNKHTAKQIFDMHGPMDVICANNVFAHVADVESFAQGVANLLSTDGVFVFENAYLLDTIKGLYFDQCYHEHLQYYGIIPLMSFLGRFGLEIFDIQHIDTQGGSFRIFAKKKESTKWSIEPSVEQWVANEKANALYEPSTYVSFRKQIESLVWKVRQFLANYDSNTSIACYGCPAKFALFSQVFNLDSSRIKYVVDESPLKYGRFSPGKKIPIVDRAHFLNNPPDLCIISVWNMASSVMSRNPQFKGKWIILMPDLKII